MNAYAFKEKQITSLVIPIIEEQLDDSKCVLGGIAFTNFNYLINGIFKLGNFNLYYGARFKQIAQRVRSNLNNQIQPITQNNSPIALNFFLAAKGLNRSEAIAKRRACYNGALKAKKLYKLQIYGQKNFHYNGNAYIFTSSYSDRQFKIYTSHLVHLFLFNNCSKYIITQINI